MVKGRSITVKLLSPSEVENLLVQIYATKTLQDLDQLKLHILGKNGTLTQTFKALKNLDEKQKQQQAKIANEAKTQFAKAFEAVFEKLQNEQIDQEMQQEAIDVSILNFHTPQGALHPINTMIDDILEYFVSLNFSIQEGPLIEDDFHNFEALNIPFYHPARDMQDTFYLKDHHLLRTHTSPVQVRTMLKQKPPIRIISPGAVFRKDYDLTHTPMFHQIEGLVVEQGNKVSFAHLKYILEDFLRYVFGNIKVRFRPSFFPFTEPSSEVDISCVFCDQEGCRVCSHTGWLEVLGCGVVDNAVFKHVGYDNVSGYAFGLGVERFTMLKRKIPDLRTMFEGDLRFLRQFQ